MFLTWQPIYSVNVKELDEQHKRIFTLINIIFEIKNNYSSEKINSIIKSLKDYGSYHLSTEERYFEKFNYPDKELHTQQHNFYRENVLKFENRINNDNNAEIIEELIDFLRDWWLNHIQNTDQQYSEFFNLHGLV